MQGETSTRTGPAGPSMQPNRLKRVARMTATRRTRPITPPSDDDLSLGHGSDEEDKEEDGQDEVDDSTLR